MSVLSRPEFHNEAKAFEHLEKVIWNGEIERVAISDETKSEITTGDLPLLQDVSSPFGIEIATLD